MAYAAALGETHARYYDTTAPEGVLAHPLFPVCYEWPLAQPLRNLPALRPLFPRLLHAQHDLRIARPPRAGETLRVSARIAGVSQRRPGAFVVFRFEARDAAGELVTVTNYRVEPDGEAWVRSYCVWQRMQRSAAGLARRRSKPMSPPHSMHVP